MDMQSSSAWFGEAFLVEFEIAGRQLLALAQAFPTDKFDWRPDATARSVSEVFVHVAGGNFFLLDVAGKLQGVWYGVSPKDTIPKALEVLKGEY